MDEENIQAKKEDSAVQLQKTLKAEIDTARVEKRAIKEDPAILWQKEYQTFKKRRVR